MGLRSLFDTIRFWNRVARLKDQPVFAIHEEPEPPGEKGLFDGPTELRRELVKLGKTQLRSQAVIEAAVERIGRMVEELKAALQQVVASDGLIKDVLLVADGLEEAIHAGEALMEAGGSGGDRPGAPEEGWLEGIRIIHRRVCQMLDKEGVRPIPSVGESFDPQLHRAVGVEHTLEVPENTIIEEERRGYRRGNQVIRYAEVVVAKSPSNERGK